MTQRGKLVTRFLSNPKDFTYSELKKLLSAFGYEEKQKGKTSGSRVMFVNRRSGHVIMIRKPHPSPVLKSYAVKQIISELQELKLL